MYIHAWVKDWIDKNHDYKINIDESVSVNNIQTCGKACHLQTYGIKKIIKKMEESV